LIRLSKQLRRQKRLNIGRRKELKWQRTRTRKNLNLRRMVRRLVRDLNRP
jgi:hypothetical protein